MFMTIAFEPEQFIVLTIEARNSEPRAENEAFDPVEDAKKGGNRAFPVPFEETKKVWDG
jgi:hypothetical protein